MRIRRLGVAQLAPSCTQGGGDSFTICCVTIGTPWEGVGVVQTVSDDSCPVCL